MIAGTLPLSGVRVLDFGHTVMGPTAGLILADLGAEVIRIEPVNGDPTRRLKGFGTGYFPFFNRNKQSVALNLKDPRGLFCLSRSVGRLRMRMNKRVAKNEIKARRRRIIFRPMVVIIQSNRRRR